MDKPKRTFKKRISKGYMKLSNYSYITRNIKKRQEMGDHDWDDDLVIINNLLKEYGTTMEDQIMSIYRRTINNWDAFVDKDPEDRRHMFNPYNDEDINSCCS